MKKTTTFILRLIFISLFIPITFARAQSNGEVRNIIYMIGDGMGVAQVSQLIIEQQLEKINMERADAVGLIRTFSANNRVTDSAAGGTALATGHKTDNGVLGLDPAGNRIKSIMEAAIEKGMKAGIVVTSYVTHATPGAFYGHTESRNNYQAIAAQFMDAGIDVVMGAARNHFDRREDGRDLLAELASGGYTVVDNMDETAGITSGKLAAILTDRGHMPAMTEGRGDYLPDAVGKALEILTNNAADGGFFLMVEGSQIDFAGHNNDTPYMIEEMRDFDKVVGVAFDYADSHPGTLVVVLADHETGGLSIPSNDGDFTAAESGVKYEYGSESHTAALIPMFAYGAGAENFSKVMDNTEVPRKMAELLGVEL